MAILKHSLTKRLLTPLLLARRNIAIMSAKLQTEKVVEEMEKTNPFFNKYSDKIAKLQKSSPEEFLSRLEGAQKLQNKPKFSSPPIPSAEAER
jgi:hypothetical protein